MLTCLLPLLTYTYMLSGAMRSTARMGHPTDDLKALARALRALRLDSPQHGGIEYGSDSGGGGKEGEGLLALLERVMKEEAEFVATLSVSSIIFPPSR